MNKFALLAILSMSLLLTACGASYQQSYNKADPTIRSPRTLAALPLVNLTSHPQAGRAVGDMLATELYATGRFQLQERTTLIDQLLGDETDLEYVMNNAVALEMGKKLGTELVIYGSVTEYRYMRGIDQNPAVGVNLRLLNVKSGKVIWASSASQSKGWGKVSLNQTAQMVLKSMVTELVSSTNK